MNLSLNNNKLCNLKMSQKIHFYVQNILDNIQNTQKMKIDDSSIMINKDKNEEKTIDNNNKKYNKYFLYKTKKNHSENILNENKILLLNKNYKNRTTFNNYITSYQKQKENNIEQINLINSHNDYFYMNEDNNTERLSKNTSLNINLKKNKDSSFQKVLFNISNIKFKHLLILFLDQKSICCLSSTNKIFHKNLRIFFFNNLSIKLLSDNKDIYINKIIRSIFKYSSFQIKNKSEFKVFYESLKYPNEIYTDIINKDLLRTFPRDPNFRKGNKYYNKLFNLLTCYSNYNKNIGYAQGLNFLFANAIYLFSSEEEIFLFADGLINYLQLENYLGIDNQNKLPEKINYISNILEKYIPNIIKVFNKKFVKIEIFLTNWILTIFSSSMNRQNLIICWCFMILFGWKFFNCFIIQILVNYRDIIYSLNEIELCKKMKNILQTDDFNRDFTNIINRTIDFMKDHILL